MTSWFVTTLRSPAPLAIWQSSVLITTAIEDLMTRNKPRLMQFHMKGNLRNPEALNMKAKAYSQTIPPKFSMNCSFSECVIAEEQDRRSSAGDSALSATRRGDAQREQTNCVMAAAAREWSCDVKGRN